MTVGKLHKHALADVFDIGKQLLIKQNILSVRQRRKKRLARVSNYFTCVHTKVNMMLSSALDTIRNTSTISNDESTMQVPEFRRKYKSNC